jgi:hypothetical protein
MRRALLGIFAVVCLVLGAYGVWTYGTRDSDWSALSSAGLRAGVLLGSLWLALPQLERLLRVCPPWLLAVAGACGVAVVVRPRLLVYLLPLLGVLLVLRFFGWLLQPLPVRKKSAARGHASPPADDAEPRAARGESR